MPYNICICIPTYKRPDILSQLLRSVQQCSINRTLIDIITIIIVDNDANKTAETISSKIKDQLTRPFELHYFNYSVKGLANVRNELIKKAFLFQPDFLAFIDDDEYVSEQWLNELLTAVIQNNTDAARGPVLASIPVGISKSKRHLLQREKHNNNEIISTWTTGNLMIRRSSLEKYGVWFDSHFNKTGSEDTYFGMQMARKGASIVWAANAITYEVIPENRTNIKWFIKRKYRGASTFMYMLMLDREYLKVTKKIAVSLIYVLAALPSLLLLVSSSEKKYWGVLKLSEGVGGFTGLFRLRYGEYK
jgi:glycosyltransferase involved in cell wall biosynthesis